MKQTKKMKRLGILCSVLVVISIATFIVTKYEEKKEDIYDSNEIVLKISSDSVETISWENGDNKFSFHKEDDNWIYDEDNDFPVDKNKILDMLSNFEEFGASFIIENVEDYEQYGLKDPDCIIKIGTSDNEYEIKLGEISQLDEQRYIDIGDGNVYLVSEDPEGYLKENLSDMILNDDIPNLDNVVDIKFSGEENYTITYIKNSKNTYSSDDVYFVEKNDKTVPLDPEKVDDYLDALSSLTLETYATYNVTDKELAKYGLDNPEHSITVQYKYTDDDEKEKTKNVVFHISRNQDELNKAETTEEYENVTKYVRIGDSKIIYEIDNTSYETLITNSYKDLRHKEVIWADFNDIKQIDITLEGEEHTLKSTKDDDDVQDWFYGKEEIEIYDFRDALQALTADSFTSQTTDQKEEISLTVHLDNKNISKVKIQIYRYDGKRCLVVVDGESVSLVERSLVMDFVETVQEIVLD